MPGTNFNDLKLTWRSYAWHYFSAVFCPWKPSEWRFGRHTTGGPAPKCSICHAPFGMCEHTGGPITGGKLDPALEPPFPGAR